MIAKAARPALALPARPGSGTPPGPEHTEPMKTRQLGPRTVSAIGLGAMPMSIEGRPGRDQAVATIHAALDAGVTLIDTADAYHHLPDDVGHSEELIAQALASYGGDTSGVLVATKGGHLRPGDGSWTVDGSPEHLKAACEASLRRLGVEAIGLYQFHRPDPKVPYAESVGAVRDLLDDGKIRLAGVSNADPDQIREAQQVLGGRLVSVQNQFSPAFRSSEPELRLCHDLGLSFLPWSPLGGISRAGGLGGRHRAFQQVADGHGVSPQQVALAWELARSPVVIPIPGSSRPATVLDSVRAVDLVLSPDELAALDGPASGGPAATGTAATGPA
jgi:aryl-alcohol dehydrogenase-like predicted oxidoreductase